MSRKYPWANVGLILMTVLALCAGSTREAQAQSGVVNAIGANNRNPYGTRANIETANPQIRDGQWSWARASVQYNPAGGPNYYVEIGWYKSNAIGGCCQVATATNNSSGYVFKLYNYFPAAGSTHTYTVIWNTALNGYDVKYDAATVDNRQSSYSLTRVFSGGEASSSQNAIGISGCLNNQYSTAAAPGTWSNYPSHYNQVAAGYYVSNISAHSWQVGGNN